MASWAGAATGVGVGDAMNTIFDQRMKAAQLQQQQDQFDTQQSQADALTRLHYQEQADAVRQRMKEQTDAAAERAQERKDRIATLAATMRPIGAPVTQPEMQNEIGAGVPTALYKIGSPPPVSVPAPPPSIAAPDDSGQPQVLPGSVANSPSPSMSAPPITWTGTQTQLEKQAEDKAKETKTPSEDQRFDTIRGRQLQNLPISSDEAAFLKSYAERKLMGPTMTTGAENQRQTNTQDFALQQAGRKELTDNVEKPYRDANAVASELRDIVTSAKAGNKFAASQQSLMGALATMRSAGMNRLPAAGVGAAAGAGSLWDRIQGAIGKQVAGEPLSKDLQDDLIAYAGLLEKSAASKYRDGFDSVTKRYKLTDEKPLTDATAPKTKKTAEELIKQYGG